MDKKKYVVYSVMVGSYGEIHQPVVIDDRFAYILFSNEISSKRVGIWEVRNFFHTEKLDDKKESRYPKSHPTELLSQFEASLYIDANVQIADEWVYNRFFELIESKVSIAGIKLIATGRDCVYRHAYDMCVMKAEHDYLAIREMRELFIRGFPEHFGMNENNLIFRIHNSVVEKVDNEWWWWIRNYSYRDQFSYMYCLWKYNMPREFFLPAGEETGNSPHFIRYPHNNDPNVAAKKWVTPGFFERIRNKIRNKRGSYEKYCDHWVILCKLPFPRLFLFLWGFIVSFFNLPYLIKQLFLSKLRDK